MSLHVTNVWIVATLKDGTDTPALMKRWHVPFAQPMSGDSILMPFSTDTVSGSIFITEVSRTSFTIEVKNVNTGKSILREDVEAQDLAEVVNELVTSNDLL